MPSCLLLFSVQYLSIFIIGVFFLWVKQPIQTHTYIFFKPFHLKNFFISQSSLISPYSIIIITSVIFYLYMTQTLTTEVSKGSWKYTFEIWWIIASNLLLRRNKMNRKILRATEVVEGISIAGTRWFLQAKLSPCDNRDITRDLMDRDFVIFKKIYV